MRVTTTYNSADEVVKKKKKKKKKKRSFVFYVPISIYNLLILDSRSSLFHKYRIWLWAFFGPWASLGPGRLYAKACTSPGARTTEAATLHYDLCIRTTSLTASRNQSK
jgi:hypothetical protein